MIDRCLIVGGDLTDEDWQRLEPLLPSMDPQGGGRWRDHRQLINGILWRVDDGAKWDQIPERYGPAKTCYHRFARWEQDGTWARILRRLKADADAGGDLDGAAQVDASVVGRGRALVIRLTPGQAPDTEELVPWPARMVGAGPASGSIICWPRRRTVTIASIMIWLRAKPGRSQP